MTIPSSRTSVLAKLTADVMAEKKTAARALTPVAGESRPAPIPTVFPSDMDGSFMSHEAMAMASKDLRRHAVNMVQIADAIDVLSGMETEVKPSPVDTTKQKEREADARAAKRAGSVKSFEDIPQVAAARAMMDADTTESFAERQTRLAEEAQAALDTVLPQLPHTPFNDLPAEMPGWKCPTHGKVIVKISSKTSRKFNGCPDCNLFER